MNDSSRARRTFAYSSDVHINYEVQGHGPVPLVFLHGFAAALTTWDDIRPNFPQERFTLYLVDLKGFGFSSKPRRGSYSVEEHAAVTTAFLEAQGLRNAVLVGHSLGGGIALLVVLEALRQGKTGLVSRLILIDCAAYPQKFPPLMRNLRLPVMGRVALGLIPLRLIVLYSLHQVYHDRSTITPERIARYEKCFGRKGMAHVLIQCVKDIEPGRYERIAERYREIGLPTLIIWGREDRIIGCEQGMRLHREIAGSRLVVIEACGHNPHEERPNETFEAIMEFLGKGVKAL